MTLGQHLTGPSYSHPTTLTCNIAATLSLSVCTSQWVELSPSLSFDSKPGHIIIWEVCSAGEGKGALRHGIADYSQCHVCSFHQY